MPHPMTAPARLNLLLPWLNGIYDEHYFEGRNPEPAAVRTDFAAIRSAIAEFLSSFDGSPAAAHLEVIDDPTPAHIKKLAVRHRERTDDDDELGELEAILRILLTQGLGDGLLGDVRDLSIPAKNLRLSVRHAGRRKPAKRGSVVAGGVTAQRDYRAAGAYVLQVQGPVVELVPFLVAHLLTAPDMVAVRRCQRSGCEHFVVTATAARGRPQMFCAPSCQKLNAEQLEQRRNQKRRQS